MIINGKVYKGKGFTSDDNIVEGDVTISNVNGNVRISGNIVKGNVTISDIHAGGDEEPEEQDEYLAFLINPKGEISLIEEKSTDGVIIAVAMACQGQWKGHYKHIIPNGTGGRWAYVPITQRQAIDHIKKSNAENAKKGY